MIANGSDSDSDNVGDPGTPLTYFTDEGSEGFFESESFAKKDFLGFMKDTGIFFGSRKKHRCFVNIVLLTAQINNNINAIYCLCGSFWGVLEKQGYFGVDKF